MKGCICCKNLGKLPHPKGHPEIVPGRIVRIILLMLISIFFGVAVVRVREARATAQAGAVEAEVFTAQVQALLKVLSRIQANRILRANLEEGGSRTQYIDRVSQEISDLEVEMLNICQDLEEGLKHGYI